MRAIRHASRQTNTEVQKANDDITKHNTNPVFFCSLISFFSSSVVGFCFSPLSSLAHIFSPVPRGRVDLELSTSCSSSGPPDSSLSASSRALEFVVVAARFDASSRHAASKYELGGGAELKGEPPSNGVPSPPLLLLLLLLIYFWTSPLRRGMSSSISNTKDSWYRPVGSNCRA